jgi:hypothetical protein
MAILTYPTIFGALLFLVSAMPSSDHQAGAGRGTGNPGTDARVLLDGSVNLDGRWMRVSGNIAVRAARPLATWEAEVATLGIRAGFAHDASGFRVDFDPRGLLSTLVGASVSSVLPIQP